MHETAHADIHRCHGIEAARRTAGSSEFATGEGSALEVSGVKACIESMESVIVT
jgi:hypothetical protein